MTKVEVRMKTWPQGHEGTKFHEEKIVDMMPCVPFASLRLCSKNLN
ncbi:MAG: hypothetical protein HY064_01715 [Bacteroidetes bacterium]|nr:hypothetical protein [Bacteroidota bacterium]